ncbi:hypothetical protein D8Y22_10155 [Salinadaptatus halalkaliphilus]|uniref:Uncharacterized protein n=1 Tax=Salinadaptatus halalkaliphilus TaxID=2419781 RepID=A0A4S3TLL6_9EURY|nr:hypothetical protein [Salinadaptatus halalkaliphilus]THE64966.1 hypothetical protein D8Y22_10155 [Salinadaptatus halalkaliphilus]
MDFDLTVTAALFVLINAAGIGGMVASGMMATDTVLMMVAPSMIVFGLVMLGIGLKYGEYRATN